MATIYELKEMLRAKGLPVYGSKAQLVARLSETQKQKSSSIKVKKLKSTLTYNQMTTNPLAIFYITTYFQNPKSKMAKDWVKSQGLSKSDAKIFYNQIMKK